MMKLSRVFAISFLVIGLIGGFIFVNYYLNQGEEVLYLNLENSLGNIAGLKVRQVDNFLIEQESLFKSYSEEEVFIDFFKSENNFNSSSEEFINAKARIDEIDRGIGVFDRDGFILVSENNPSGVRVPDLSFFYGLEDDTGHIIYYDPSRRNNYLGLLFLVKDSFTNETLGAFGGDIELEKLNEVVSSLVDSKRFPEVYLVDENLFLLTPSHFLKGENKGVLTQVVDTENVQNCFNETFPGHMYAEEPIIIIPFLNYMGEEVLGTHREIFETGWCLLIEVNKEEVIGAHLNKELSKAMLFLLIFVLVLTFIGFFIGRIIDKRNKGRKIRKYPCGYIGFRKLLFCRLTNGRCQTYPNGKCGFVVSFRKFFIDLELKYYFLFALVFAIGYFFLVTSLFQGWQNAKLFDDIPDLLIFVLGFMFFAFGLKIKNMKSRKFIILGGLLICFRRLLDIPFQEYQEIIGHILSLVFWVPVFLAEFSGFVLLLIGFRRLKYGT